MIKDSIKKYALLFNNIKELGNNEGWEHRYFEVIGMTFQELMVTVGWKKGQPWCGYFAKAIWLLAYAEHDSTMVEKLKALLSGSSLQTYKNFKKSDFEVSLVPSVGSIAIWQMYRNGKGTVSGHEAVVIEPADKTFYSIEGNTNRAGSREGDQSSGRTHKVDFAKKENGLVLLGFIHPKAV